MVAPDGVGTLSRELDALLPQTQCTRCGYGGCLPYAEAMARGQAGPDRCPPGGTETLVRLAARLGVAPRPLDPACGVEGPARVAVIDEARCIGCTHCLPPCPVDAIVGAKRHLHAVITAHCTGCELCLPPCPVDCITLVTLESVRPGTAPPTPAANRARHDAHTARRERRAAERDALIAARKRAAYAGAPPGSEPEPRA